MKGRPSAAFANIFSELAGGAKRRLVLNSLIAILNGRRLL